MTVQVHAILWHLYRTLTQVRISEEGTEGTNAILSLRKSLILNYFEFDIE